MNIDILDKAPQFPGGPWANHAIYGTLLGLALMFMFLLIGFDFVTAWKYASVITLFISGSKKIYDYTDRGPALGETAIDCIGKTFVTAAGIFCIGAIWIAI